MKGFVSFMISFSGKVENLHAVLRKTYAKTKKKFIFLIDEWNCVMREWQESDAVRKQYLDFFEESFERPALRYARIYDGDLTSEKIWNPTGLGLHSTLNIFTEYPMTNQDVFEEYTGFTKTEVKELVHTI